MLRSLKTHNQLSGLSCHRLQSKTALRGLTVNVPRKQVPGSAIGFTRHHEIPEDFAFPGGKLRGGVKTMALTVAQRSRQIGAWWAHALSPGESVDSTQGVCIRTGSYCQTGSARLFSVCSGVGVWLRSRSLIAEWQTMQDRCVRFPSCETKAYVSPCKDQVTTL
jgi:hypothetical protein